MSDFNQQIIEEFRANGGKVERFGDSPLVILHTIGARSGKVREIPLVALAEDDDLFVIASAAGSPKHPDWYYNLIANPEIDVEYRTDRFTAVLRPLDEPERTQRMDAQIQAFPQFGEYVTSAAPRVIPVFAIDRLS